MDETDACSDEGGRYSDKITDLDTEALITTVQSFPLLYDKDDPNYNNRRQVYRIWKKIGEELNAPGDTVKRRWVNLRDYFFRCHRVHVKTRRKVKWMHYKAMSFLLPHAPTFAEAGSSPAVPMEPSEPLSYLEEVGETPLRVRRKQNSLKSGSSCPKPPKPNRLEDSPKGHRNGVCKHEVDSDSDDSSHSPLYTHRHSPPAHSVRREEPEDEDLLFFKSLIPKMKYFNEIQKMEVQAELHSVILKHIKLVRAAESAPPLSVNLENVEVPKAEL